MSDLHTNLCLGGTIYFGCVRSGGLWFLVYVMLYAAVAVLASTSYRPFPQGSDDRPDGGLGRTWFLLGWSRGCWLRVWPGSISGWCSISGIDDQCRNPVRQAFDPSLFLTRAGAAALLAGGVFLWARRGLRVQAGRRFQWIAGVLAAICGAILIVLNATEPGYRRDPVDPVEPVGRLPFATRYQRPGAER